MVCPTVRCVFRRVLWLTILAASLAFIPGQAAASQLAINQDHACAVRVNGTVGCWGLDTDGALGNGRPDVPHETPVTVRGIHDATDVALGAGYSCALRRTGGVACWGVGEWEPVTMAGIHGARQLVVAGDWVCAVLEDHTAGCWLARAPEQEGPISVTWYGGRLVTPVALGQVRELRANRDGALCAIKTNGIMRCARPTPGLKATGADPGPVDDVALGPGNWCAVQLGHVTCGDFAHNPSSEVTGLTDARRVAIAQYGSCAVRSTGAVDCWGDFGGYKLTTITGIDDAVDIVANARQMCALKQTGAVACWGIGFDVRTTELVPRRAVTGISDAARIEVGDRTACAISTDDIARCWGDNNGRQLVPVGGVPEYLAPAVIMWRAAVIGLSEYAHGESCFTVLLNGLVNGLDCQGDDARLNPNGSPWPATAGPPVDGLDVGGRHGCGIDQTKHVRCWGWGRYGQLGFDPGPQAPTDRAPSQLVPGIDSVEEVQAAGRFTCARRTGGDVWCWGAIGAAGRSAATRVQPRQILGLPKVTQIAAKGGHACALALDGHVWCWGAGAKGELGNGGTSDSDDPVEVSGLDDAVQIGLGEQHSCAVRANHAVVCWGQGRWGALGNGSTAGSSTPKPVTGLDTAVQVDGGQDHTCALRLDKTVICWGVSTSGQLGDGNEGVRSPVSGATRTVMMTGVLLPAAV